MSKSNPFVAVAVSEDGKLASTGRGSNIRDARASARATYTALSLSVGSVKPASIYIYDADREREIYMREISQGAAA